MNCSCWVSSVEAIRNSWSHQHKSPRSRTRSPVSIGLSIVTISLSTAAKGVRCSAYSQDAMQLKRIGDYALVGASDGCVPSDNHVVHIAYQGQASTVGSPSSVELQAYPAVLTAALGSLA